MEKEAILSVLPSIRYAALFAAFDKLGDLMDLGYEKPCEEEYEIFWESLGVVIDFVDTGFVDEYEVNTWYFSDRNMMEYYRLCRTYGSRYRMKLKDNPYMQEAENFVESSMDLGERYGYGWTLQTKINHKWASGIVFRSDSYFCGEFGLVTALLEIQEWYKNAVYRLRGKMLEERLLWLPALPAPKEETL